jgi:hypothetical protein
MTSRTGVAPNTKQIMAIRRRVLRIKIASPSPRSSPLQRTEAALRPEMAVMTWPSPPSPRCPLSIGRSPTPDNFKPNIQNDDDRSDPNISLSTYYVTVKAAGGNFDHMVAYFPLVMGDTPSLWLNNLTTGSITS